MTDSSYSKVFSKNFIRKFCTNEIDKDIINIIQKDTTLYDFFENSFDQLSKKENRAEYFYKNTIIKKFIFGIHSPNTSTIIHELKISDSKADLALVTNKDLIIFEIKSERDTLNRLNHQINNYKKISPKIYVVVAEKHIQRCLEILPSNIGILLCNRKNQIQIIRESIEDFSEISIEEIFKVLRIKEIKELSKNELNAIDSRLKTKKDLTNQITVIDKRKIYSEFIKVIFRNRAITRDIKFIKKCPESLTSFITSTKLSKIEKTNLISNLFLKIGNLKIESTNDILSLLASKTK